MDWKKLFDKRTLGVGKRYLDKGYVTDFSQDGNVIRATVNTGKEVYKTNIDNPGEPDMKLRCSCYFAFSGFSCYHMAAALFYWERESMQEGIAGYRKAKSIFTDVYKQGQRRPYFCIPDMLENYYIGDDEYKEALSMINEKRIVERRDFDTFYSSADNFTDKDRLCLSGYFICKNPERSGEVYVTVNSDGILSLKCGVCGRSTGKRNREYYYSTGGYGNDILCAHMTAALLLTDEYTRLYDPGDSTDKKAENILGYFKREREQSFLKDNGEKTGNVNLIPRLVYDGRSYDVSFKIGNGGKLYIVKTLLDLYNAVNNGLIYTLGKNCQIDFSKETFDERSRKLFEMIERDTGVLLDSYNRKSAEYDFFYDPDDIQTMKSVELWGQVLDCIYENFQGVGIEFKGPDGFTDTIVPVAEKIPLVDICIEPAIAEKDKKKNEPAGIKVSGEIPVILKGTYDKYSLIAGKLCAIDDETWGKIKPFYDAVDMYTGTFSLEIGNKKAADFYYNIWPILTGDPAFNAREKDDTASKIIQEAEFVFFLDVEKGRIICSAKAKYEDETHTIMPYGLEDILLSGYRDSYRENEVRQVLGNIFEDFDPDSRTYYIEDNDDMKYEFMKDGVRRLILLGETKGTDSFNALKIRKSTPVSFGVSIESDLLSLDIKTEDMEPEELLSILDSYKKKKKYHKLRNGDFVELEGNDSLDSIKEMTDLLGVDPGDYIKGHLQIPAYRALYLDKMLEEHEDLAAERDKNFKAIIKNFKTIKDSEFEVPGNMGNILRGYQEYGYKWLRTLESAGFGGILADDMGLGKTLQLICLLEAAKNDESLNALVICPASLVYNWIEELKKFAPDMKTAALAGTKSERKKLLDMYKDLDVLVTSYDLLKREVDLYEEKTFTHQIIDEAQYIKNARAQAAKAVKLVRAKHRFALTGTPIENRLGELWSIFDFLMPGFLYGYERFKSDFEIPITKNGDEKAMEGLKKMVSPFLLRRKKKDVLKDLPDKVEEVLYAGMETKQRRIYDAQVAKIVGLVSETGNDFDKNKIAILAEITKTRQICCDPGLLFENYDGESAKRLACMDLVRNVADSGHKTLLFSQFTSMLELLEEDLRGAGLKYYKITGATPKEDRVRLVKEFNCDDTPVFLISLKAGGTGLNLTGADIVIHYDPWWNTAAQDQATDRAHRIGQTKKVTVYRIIAKDTIEEKILKLQETKKELADSVLSGETRSLGSMTKEELLDILG